MKPPPADDERHWQPAAVVDYRKRGRRIRWAILVVALLAVLSIAALIVVPLLIPKDPREVVLRNYLSAVRDGRKDEARQWGVLDDPPQTQWVRDVQARPDLDSTWTGAFAPIAEFNEHLLSKYRPQGDVYIKRDMTGTLAKLINLREEIKADGDVKLEDRTAAVGADAPPEPPKPAGRRKDELDEAVEFAEKYAGAVDKLSDILIGGPENQAVAVTHEQVIADWGGKLDPDQRALLDSFRKNREKWNRLLGRDFETIRENLPFRLEQSVWESHIWLPSQSAGEEPRRVRVTLVRFGIGLIDSGWKVWEIVPVD